MFQTLLTVHSFIRWAVLLSLGYTIFRSWQGYRRLLPFTKTDNALRHWTATIAHIQLMLGIVLYTQSPAVKAMGSETIKDITDPVFFGMIHIALMLAAIVIITIGSAKSKRKAADHEKFRTMFTFFSIALAIIFIAIPWPFSPLAQRPYLRHF